MLQRAKDLRGYGLAATDGDIGEVEDLLFDDVSWLMRYVVVDTGGWLTGRRVLISPTSLRPLDHDNRRIPVSLRKEQVENAPGLETDQPVSRQYETELSSYYGWPRYWGTASLAGFGAAPIYPAAVPGVREADIGGGESRFDPNLRSVNEVRDYDIQATDGRIGHVEDFVLDGEDWAIRYLVVDTGHWLPGRKVIIPVGWIIGVSWTDRSVIADVTKDSIRMSPEYDPDIPLTREYEEALFESYQRAGYWEQTEREQREVMDRPLEGYRVAILVTDNFERVELTEPREALIQAGAIVTLVAPKDGEVQSMEHDTKADTFPVDLTLDRADSAAFDAVLLPGGVMNADHLRMNHRAQEFVRRINQEGKPIAVICHAPWLLVSAGLVAGRTLTSYHSLQDDIRNAGGRWQDAEVIRDRNWVSSRTPRDIPAFNREMITIFAERAQTRRAA